MTNNLTRGVDVDESTQTKTCTRCDIQKSTAEFSLDSRNGKARPACKACVSEYGRQHYLRNRDKRREQAAAWYEANRDGRNLQQRAWYEANREKAAEYQRQYQAARPGYRAALVRQWRAQNVERDLLNSRAWREANRERLREAGRGAYAANPEKYVERAARRRAVVSGVNVEKVDVASLWTGTCGICELGLDREIPYPDPMSKSLDHIVPLSRGGAHARENLQWAHFVCNIRKGARLPD